MIDHSILVPAMALLNWTLVIWLMMVWTRASAFRKAKLRMADLPPGTRGPDLDGKLDPRAQWKAHNYTHLMEQPTLFYAACLSLAVLGQNALWLVVCAWLYLALRILHSLVQVSSNVVLYRGILFGLSSLCLVPLGIAALLAAL